MKLYSLKKINKKIRVLLALFHQGEKVFHDYYVIDFRNISLETILQSIKQNFIIPWVMCISYFWPG